MTLQRLFLQRTTTRCSLSVHRNHPIMARKWSIAALPRPLFPKRQKICAFGTSSRPPPETPTPLVQFSNARLAYPKDGIHDAPGASSTTIDDTNPSADFLPASSELYLKNFSIVLPNWNDPADVKYKQGDDGGERRNRRGGIAIVGKNGSGKTLLGKAIIAAGASSKSDANSTNPYVLSGSVEMPMKELQKASASARKDRHLLGRAGRTARTSPRSTTAVAHVSFDSHRRLLEERDEKTGEIVTAFKAIASAGNAPGRLNPAARFLVIRFGLYPMLHRTVDTLSTGEIRKVLLARALSTKPSLLILDHAFDGLDVFSRKILQELVSKTIKGFTNDLLVQGISSKDTAEKTQVVVMAHRAEELDEIQELDTVTWWGKPCGSADSNDKDTWNILRRTSLVDDHDQSNTTNTTWSSGKEVLHRAMGFDLTTKPSEETTMDIDWEDPSLPSEESVRNWWNFGLVNPMEGREVLVEAKDLTVQKDDVTLLQNLTWTVERGERWIVGGGNGAGKSTLSRLLALHPMAATDSGKDEKLRILPHRNLGDPRANIGWVSTESHMQHQQNDRFSKSTRDFLLDHSRGASWNDVVLPVLEWLGILGNHFSSGLLDRPFLTLSQGEQKMVLIAASLVARPPLLILDEPCQGLDVVNRRRLLQIVERICRSTDMALIYITHHLDEELVPSISHALHLKDRREVYKGPIEHYSPEEYFDDEERQ